MSQPTTPIMAYWVVFHREGHGLEPYAGFGLCCQKNVRHLCFSASKMSFTKKTETAAKRSLDTDCRQYITVKDLRSLCLAQNWASLWSTPSRKPTCPTC